MGRINIKKIVDIVIDGRLYADADGNFLGEYFSGQTVYVEHRPPPADAIALPDDASPPPSRRHRWDGAAWADPGPSEAERTGQERRAEARKVRDAALGKLEALGFTIDDLKALGFQS